MEGFVLFPLNLMGLPDELVKLYIAIRSFDWQKEGEDRTGCTAKVETLAEIVHKGRTQVTEGLRALEACGAIRRENRKPLPNRILCTPENFDPTKLPAPRKKKPITGIPTDAINHRDPDDKQPGSRPLTPGIPIVNGRDPGGSLPNSELETGSRDSNQRQEVETRKGVSAPGPVLAFRLSSPEPQEAPRKPKAARKAKGVPVLPEWIPAAVWDEWLAFRREKRAPMPDTTVRKQLAQLEAWRRAGHDPVAIIQHSIMQGYTGLFEPKGKPAAGGRWAAQPNRPTAREDQEFTEADLDRLLEESR